MLRFAIALFSGAGLVAVLTAGAQPPDGAAIFARNCASCHDGATGSRAPAPDVLRQRSPEAILTALTAGGMRPQGGRLSGAERRAVAEYLSGKALGGDITGAKVGRCDASTTSAPLHDPAASPAWNGWSPSVTNTRFQSAAAAGLTADQVPKLTLQWAFGFPDATSAWSQPTVAGGRSVHRQPERHRLLARREERLHRVDVHAQKAACGRRSRLDRGEGSTGFAVYFGDTGANVYALDAATGHELWSRRMDDHPLARITGSPTLFRGSPLRSGVLDRRNRGAASRATTAARSAAASTRSTRKPARSSGGRSLVPEAQPAGKNAAGVMHVGTLGRRRLGGADDRRQTRPRVRGDRQRLQRPAQPRATRSSRSISRAGAIKWIKQLTDAGRVRLPRRQSPTAARRPVPTSISARRQCSSPSLTAATSSSSARSPGWPTPWIPTRRARRSGSIAPAKDRSGAASSGARPSMANTRIFRCPTSATPKPGGLHAVDLATGERAWNVPPPPLACTAGTGCNAALISAPTLIPGVLFSGSNDGALRAHSTKDGVDSLAVRHQPRVPDAEWRPRRRRRDSRPRSRPSPAACCISTRDTAITSAAPATCCWPSAYSTETALN